MKRLLMLYDKNDIPVGCYESIKEASELTGIKVAAIDYMLHRNKTTKDKEEFMWVKI